MRLNRWFYFASLAVILIAFIHIGIKLEFWPILLIFGGVGFLSTIKFQENSLYLFLCLFPFINSSPELISANYAFNYIAPSLFLLGGMVLASFVKHFENRGCLKFKSGKRKENNPEENKKRQIFARVKGQPEIKRQRDLLSFAGLDKGFFLYYAFILLLVISTLFLIYRWSNFSFESIAAFGADTPIAPEGPFSPDPPQSQRISFGFIFPLVSLLIYFISPYIFFYIKKMRGVAEDQSEQKTKDMGKLASLFNNKLGNKGSITNEFMVFKWVSIGFYISVAIALIQKISGRSLISDRLGKELKQFYGGSSDFNAFGFFSGVMFLWSTDKIKEKNLLGYITFFISLGGIFLSGSRTAFLFILVGMANVILGALKGQKKQQRLVAIFLVIGVILLVIFAGGSLKKRLSEGFSEEESLFKKLNAISNGRLWMTLFSLETVRDYGLPGIGTGNFTFYLTYKNYRTYKELGEKYLYDMPLNHYLLIFTENGIFGFIFFSLFMIFLWYRSQKRLLIGTILITLLLNNFFWFPENILLFWVLVALYDTDKKPRVDQFLQLKGIRITLLLFSALLMIIGNIVSFKTLHPTTWAQNAGYRFDYGFWYKEINQQGKEFYWTKEKAGIYINLDKNGSSQSFKVFCGAPLAYFEEKKQKLEVYWQGKLYKDYVFNENRDVEFKINSNANERGFLEFKIFPVFNLKNMNLGNESRDLGIQLYCE